MWWSTLRRLLHRNSAMQLRRPRPKNPPVVTVVKHFAWKLSHSTLQPIIGREMEYLLGYRAHWLIGKCEVRGHGAFPKQRQPRRPAAISCPLFSARKVSSSDSLRSARVSRHGEALWALDFERRRRREMHLHPVGLLSRLSRHRLIVGIAALSFFSTACYPSYAFAETFSNKLHVTRGGGERNMNNDSEASDPFSRSIKKVVVAGGTHGNEVRLVEATLPGFFSANPQSNTSFNLPVHGRVGHKGHGEAAQVAQRAKRVPGCQYIRTDVFS